MAISVTEIGTAASSSATNTLVLTVAGGGAPIGAKVIVGVMSHTTNGYTLADSQGNIYSVSGGSQLFDTSTGSVQMFAAPITTALSNGDTITLTIGAAGTAFSTMQALSITGWPIVPVNPFFDKGSNSANQVGVTTIATGTTAVLSSNNELAIAFYAYVGSPSFTKNANFTSPATAQVSTTGTVYSASMGYAIRSSTAVVNANATIGAAQNAVGITRCFVISLSQNNNNYTFIRAGDGMSTSEKLR